MARLRYNGLTAALGASLTNSATSITFAAGLTHSGGTNVPTIAGSDYIPLTILDSSGNVSEIVYLTAYTAAATTGTISRGQEGTSGVAHSSDDKIVHASNVLDAGAMVLISAQVVTSAVADIDFTSIPNGFRDLVVEAKVRSNRASQLRDNVSLRVGTGGSIDTGSTNYRAHVITRTNATFAVDTNSTGTLYVKVAENACPAATADADVWGALSMTIFDYADATYWRAIESAGAAHLSSTAMYRDDVNGHWKNKAGAIDCLRLTTLNGQFIVGSSFRLYGRL